MNTQCSIFDPHILSCWALKKYVTPVPNSILSALLTLLLGTRGSSMAAHDNRQAVDAHPRTQQDTHMHQALTDRQTDNQHTLWTCSGSAVCVF